MNDPDLVGVVADPIELWRCGSSYYPQIAVSYAKSGGKLSSAAQLPSSAFNRMESNPRGEYMGTGEVPFYLGQLRDELHRMLGESVDNLFASGDALEKVAWAYETTDGKNATGLKQAVKSDLERNRNNTDDTPIWTDDERQKQIKDSMNVPPK